MTDWTALRDAGLELRARHFSAYANPKDAHARLLRDILDALIGSQFARDHNLHPEMSLEAFRAAVPVRRYADYSPWMSRLIDGDVTALSARPPLALELTGGSAGGRKPVPMTPTLLNGFRRGLVAWLGDLGATWPSICAGKTYFALSPALRVAPDPIGSWPIGLESDLAYLGDEVAPLLAPHLVFTPQIAGLTDPREWQIATLAMLLGAEDLSFISLWSPRFLTALLVVLASNPEIVLKMIHEGGAGLASNPDRAGALNKLDALTPQNIWPNLALISTWADGSAAPHFAALSKRMPGVALQGKGLLATEGLFTLPFQAFADPLPAILSSLLEFRDAAGDCHFMWDIEVGETYDLIVTPVGGFARYAIGDRVKCTGWALPDVPMLRFVGRGDAHSDLVGEKLNEAFVLHCLTRSGIEGVLVAHETGAPHYKLLVKNAVSDHAMAQLELELRHNPQYAYARELGQLGPLKQQVFPDFVDRLVERRLKAGHRLSDIKTPVLLSGPQVFDLLGSEF